MNIDLTTGVLKIRTKKETIKKWEEIAKAHSIGYLPFFSYFQSDCTGSV